MKFQADPGEIEKAKILVDALNNAKSEKDQFKAVKAIAKYLGMMNQQVAKDKLAIMQRFDCGTVMVVKIMKNLAENAQSEEVKLKTLELCAKCLGMF